MCGRFTLTVDPAELQELFGLSEPAPAGLMPRYNIAPTQPVAVIPNQEPRRLELFRWGLIPSWAKDPKIGNSLINARAETAAEKPAFRAALRRRRCLIPADGFYEWKKSGRTKTPMYIQMRSGLPFAFAGLWDVWSAPDGSTVPTCTILTTTANALVRGIHDRMPVILPPEAFDLWLTPGELPAAEVQAWLRPFAAEAMTARAVSSRVNNPRNEGRELLMIDD